MRLLPGQGFPILLHLLPAELVKVLASITVGLQFSLSFDLDSVDQVCIALVHSSSSQRQGEIWKDFQVDVRRVWDSRPQGSCKLREAAGSN